MTRRVKIAIGVGVALVVVSAIAWIAFAAMDAVEAARTAVGTSPTAGGSSSRVAPSSREDKADRPGDAELRATIESKVA